MTDKEEVAMWKALSDAHKAQLDVLKELSMEREHISKIIKAVCDSGALNASIEDAINDYSNFLKNWPNV